MSNYLSTLTANQLSNIFIAIDEMNKAGITNIHTQAAILDVVSKESGFYPQDEDSYKNTSNARIRKLFGSRVPSDDIALNTLKQNDRAFFDAVYGGRYGNAKDEGYKYRGRGFNQLTFKGNYTEMAKKIGVDIVSNPDLANRIDVAVKILIEYFKDKFADQRLDINGFSDSPTALKRVFEANRGFGKGSIDSVPDVTGGYALTVSRLADFDSIVGQSKKKKITSYLIILGISLIVYYVLLKSFSWLSIYKVPILICIIIVVYIVYEKTSLKDINNLVI